MERVVDEIAERVRLRLLAHQRGTEAPCEVAPPKAAPCAERCSVCSNSDSCGVSGAVRGGVARLAPDSIRTSSEIAPYIDHTLLKPDATREEVIQLAEEARKYGFATVCVNSSNVGVAARVLQGSGVLPIAVVGFPLGAALPTAKAFEAREAIRCGAREIDTVVNIGALRARDYALVLKDIAAVVEAARPHPVKVILETSQLSEDEKIAGCVLSKAAGAAFVKTSTGFGGGGATAADVALMRRVVGEDMGVKASEGIRSTTDALQMIAAGANRIGASASVAIVRGQKSDAKY